MPPRMFAGSRCAPGLRVVVLMALLLGGVGSARGGDVAAPHISVPDAAATDPQMLTVLAVYCAVIALASLMGGWLPTLLRLTHLQMQIVISFVGGLMLGIGVFHMLVHSVVQLQSLHTAVGWMMLGILAIFFLMRAFHFHQHAVAPAVDSHAHDTGGEHRHDYRHHHAVHVPAGGHPARRHSWIGVALGMALHSLIDGIALGASIRAESGHGAGGWTTVGFGTFLAIVLHKPLDAVSITTLMTAGEWSTASRRAVNWLYALTCPVGAGLFLWGLVGLSPQQHLVVGSALAFSAGVFLCIALVDLLPEMEFHSHSRLQLSAALLAGIGLAYAIGYLEPGHLHGFGGR